MKERGISEAAVFKVLAAPTSSGLPTPAGRERDRLQIDDDSAIDVVYQETPQLFRVITVMVVRTPHRRARQLAKQKGNQRKKRRRS